MKTLATAIAGSMLTIGLLASPAQAQNYPSSPIKVIVPNGAGGGTDVVSRLVANAVGEKLGGNMAIVNMGGGGTSIGAMAAAGSKADGYTLLSTHEAFLTSSATGINTKGPKSMTPIAQVAKEVLVLTVRKGSKLSDLNQFYAAAKKGHGGGKLKLGVNPGAANHFWLLNALTSVDHDVLFVPTGGGAKTMKALLGGTIDASMFDVGTAGDSIKSGALVPLAVFDSVRHPGLPDVKTAKEQGHDISIGLHYVWYAPTGTPADRIAKLAGAFEAVMADQAFVKTLTNRTTTPALITGAKLRETLDARFSVIQEQANKYVLGK